MDGYVDGCPQDNSSTQWINFGLRAMKIDGNIETRAGAKMNPKCMMHGYTGGCHWDK